MAEDFQPSNWWNTSKNCDEHSDSNLQLSGFGFTTSSTDWNQTILSSSRTGGAESSFHAMLHEDLSPGSFFQQELKEANQPFLLDSSSSSSSYGCSTTMPMMQGIIEPDTKFRQSFFDNQQMTDHYQPQMMVYGGGSNEIQQNSGFERPQLFKGLPQNQQPAINQLKLTNNASFWNASSGFYHSPLSPIGTQLFDTKPNCSTLSVKGHGEPQDIKSSSESALKKPRTEMPSPPPALKVRKEKLGDRITALQQLVSPFGKTDTASVLHEAIEYIKFLHDQVSVLSTPYLKSGHSMQQHKNSGKSTDGEDSRQDLRSRGLCLVPIASTYPVTCEASADFWSPTFGGA